MSKPILDNLFGSKIRVKILKFVFRKHPSGFTIRDVAKRVQESPLEVKKELELLQEMGLVRRKS